MAKMSVRFIVGLNGDRVQVKISEDDKCIFQEDYSYGYNASYNRMFAEIAAKDHEDAIKYGWRSIYSLKPFKKKKKKELIETYYIGNDDIEYSGYYVLAGREATPEEVQKKVDAIADEV